ncbi:hypothetical protein [Actinoplanes sp. NPDC051494]|uniref:hypothetical protein n=1 Tax=Actinoplanes sp. NPDC051494 TaxID=3363907 RepID=UPI00378A01E1
MTDDIPAPVLDAVLVTPTTAPAGEQVTVRWQTRYADTVEVTGPDGTTVGVPPARVDDGSARIVVTRPGPITLHLRNAAGTSRHTTRWVHVFELPRMWAVPVPAAPPLTSGRALSDVADLISGAWTGAPAPAGPIPVPPFDPSTALTSFPYDVGRWFFRRPTFSRSRIKKWWRSPWA